MQRNEEESKVLDRLVESLKTFSQIKQIILFGSRARGDAAPRADIDIAVVCPEITDAKWLAICESVEEFNTLLEIDLVNYDKVSKELQNNISQDGIVLYERD